MATAVDGAIAELTTAHTTLAPDLRGTTEYAELTNGDPANPAVQDLLGKVTRRNSLLEAALQALQALVADGYPVVPTEVVDATSLQTLDRDLAALTAARALFTPRQPPASGIVTPAPPQTP